LLPVGTRQTDFHPSKLNQASTSMNLPPVLTRTLPTGHDLTTNLHARLDAQQEAPSKTEVVMAQVPDQHIGDDVAAADAPHEVKPIRPMLWWLLAVAAIAAAALWFNSQRSVENIAPVAEQPSVEQTAPEETPAAIAEQRRQAPTARKQTTKPAVAQSRQARPLANNVTPKYPPAALRSGIGGTVLVRAEVDAAGNPVTVTVAKRSGNRDLDRAAVNAVRNWRFEPAMRDGKATASVVQVPVDFKPI
jgi:periplasmic protein TonB